MKPTLLALFGTFVSGSMPYGADASWLVIETETPKGDGPMRAEIVVMEGSGCVEQQLLSLFFGASHFSSF